MEKFVVAYHLDHPVEPGELSHLVVYAEDARDAESVVTKHFEELGSVVCLIEVFDSNHWIEIADTIRYKLDDPRLNADLYADDEMVQCWNCEKVWRSAAIESIHEAPSASKILTRLEPGATVPHGICPECDHFCYAVEPHEIEKI